MVRVPHEKRSEPFVEIFLGRGNQRRLATCIARLRWTNKTLGEHGRDLYLRKQREVLASKLHLVEIELLRGGKHTTAVPEHTTAVPWERLVRVAGQYEYHVSIHRFDNLEDSFVYPIRLDEPLPEIGVPLWPGGGEVGVDLQGVLERTYEAGPYSREFDFGQDALQPPGPPAWQAWLEGILRARQPGSSALGPGERPAR